LCPSCRSRPLQTFRPNRHCLLCTAAHLGTRERSLCCHQKEGEKGRRGIGILWCITRSVSRRNLQIPLSNPFLHEPMHVHTGIGNPYSVRHLGSSLLTPATCRPITYDQDIAVVADHRSSSHYPLQEIAVIGDRRSSSQSPPTTRLTPIWVVKHICPSSQVHR
jgi:hypothetical protein